MKHLPATAQGSGGDFLFERLREEVERSSRHNIPLVCVLFRVRQPEQLEESLRDRLAHAGAILARRMVRGSDVVAFLGDGHFGIVANAPREGARTLAHAVATELKGLEFTHQGEQLKIDVGYGISVLEDGKTPRGLLEEARAALDLAYATHQIRGCS